MSYKELLKQKKALDQQLLEAREKEIQTFREKVLAEAAELEIDVYTLFPTKKGVAKYKNPETGAEYKKGPRPAWLRELIDAGREDEALNPAWLNEEAVV